MYKKDLALNNLQWLICHKTKLNQSKPICRSGKCAMTHVYRQAEIVVSGDYLCKNKTNKRLFVFERTLCQKYLQKQQHKNAQ